MEVDWSGSRDAAQRHQAAIVAVTQSFYTVDAAVAYVRSYCEYGEYVQTRAEDNKRKHKDLRSLRNK